MERTVWREGILNPPRVLHGDNGSPLKGATVQALLGRLGITASFSRPRVSDDNARSLSRAQSRGAAAGWLSCAGAMSCMRRHDANIQPAGPVTRATGVTFEKSG